MIARHRRKTADHATNTETMKTIQQGDESTENALFLYAGLFFLIIGLCVILINLHEVRLLADQLSSPHLHPKPVVWIHKGRLSSFSPLFHIERVLSGLGFTIVRDVEPPHWDLFWSHEYPYDDDAPFPVKDKWLDSHQKANKIPGIGHVTSKLALIIDFNASYLPPVFVIPDQIENLINFSQNHPNSRWLEKSITHRGIYLKSLEDLIRETPKKRLAQQFVEDPLLIDDRKFDIGVYAVVTELRPLRVFVYEGDVLLRFCRRNYAPDLNDTESYVIADFYTPAWDIPSLRPLLSSGLSYRSALAAFLTRRNASFQDLWRRFRHIIADVMVRKVSAMLTARRKLRAPLGSVFELVRFDFLLDSRFQVHLLEINMSPNMASEGKPMNAQLYEAVLRDTFSLVGIGATQEVENWEIAPGAVDCSNVACMVCDLPQCRICLQCLNDHEKLILQSTVKEHINRRYMRRVLPQPACDEAVEGPTTDEDGMLRTWFTAKCKDDSSWCR